MAKGEWFRRPVQAAYVDQQSTGNSDIAGTLQMRLSAGTTAANFGNTGITTFGATAAKTYDLDVPFAGAIKVLFCLDGATGAIQKVRGASGSDFFSTAGAKEVLQFNHDGEAALLFGRSTTQWIVLSQQALAFSTA